MIVMFTRKTIEIEFKKLLKKYKIPNWSGKTFEENLILLLSKMDDQITKNEK